MFIPVCSQYQSLWRISILMFPYLRKAQSSFNWRKSRSILILPDDASLIPTQTMTLLNKEDALITTRLPKPDELWLKSIISSVVDPCLVPPSQPKLSINTTVETKQAGTGFV